MIPTNATEASGAFLQSRARLRWVTARRDDAVRLWATASLHCLRRHAPVLSRQTGPSGVGITVPYDRAHSVVVRAPYGLTATTASSSVDGRWRDVTVTHSPGFTVLIADNPLSGTLTRIVMY
jgi:hypothetical protein